MRDAEIDQARFLASGDDLDRMPQGLLGRAEKARRLAQATHGIGRHRPHAPGRQHAQALAKARQTGQCLVAARRFQAAVAAQPSGQTHAVAQAVD